MNRLLISTALATALAAPLAAQDIAVPEGFQPYDDITRLTFDTLDGATVHDVNGESLGEISNIIFDSEPFTEPGTDTTAVDPAMGTDTTAADPAMDTTADATLAPTAGDQAADDVAAIAEQAADDITETATEAVEDINAAVEDATDELAATDTTGDATPGPGDDVAYDDTAADDMGQQLTAGGGRVSHVLIDMGGFLGLGVHTVAIPIEALQIYADANETLQIYLPWTEEQIRDLPEYQEGNPETLGRMASE